jgi:hypothetical protein
VLSVDEFSNLTVLAATAIPLGVYRVPRISSYARAIYISLQFGEVRRAENGDAKFIPLFFIFEINR